MNHNDTRGLIALLEQTRELLRQVEDTPLREQGPTLRLRLDRVIEALRVQVSQSPPTMPLYEAKRHADARHPRRCGDPGRAHHRHPWR
jgi:hypothetical protein